MASSEKMLQQIHTIVLDLHPVPAAGSAPADLGCAAQVTVGQGTGTPEWGHAFPVPPVLTNHSAPEQPMPFGYGANDNVAPWPTADFMRVPGNDVLGSLPRAMQELMASCASVSLPLHARIPMPLGQRFGLVSSSTCPSSLSQTSSSSMITPCRYRALPLAPLSACPRQRPSQARPCLFSCGCKHSKCICQCI